MFCANCGKDVPADSQFCLRCGKALTQAAQFAQQGSGKSSRNSRAVVGVGLTVILLALVAVTLFSHVSGGKTPLAPIFPPNEHTQPIANGAITVRAVNYTWFKFQVPPGATNVTVDGHFEAVGGTGNDIEAFIFGEDAFVNFQNRHPDAASVYESGRVTQQTINTVLPGGGTYYLVFSNRFSLITPKAVQVNAVAHYTD